MKPYKLNIDQEESLIDDIRKLFRKQDEYIAMYPRSITEISNKYNISRQWLYYIMLKYFDAKWLEKRKYDMLFYVWIRKIIYSRDKGRRKKI